MNDASTTPTDRTASRLGPWLVPAAERLLKAPSMYYEPLGRSDLDDLLDAVGDFQLLIPDGLRGPERIVGGAVWLVEAVHCDLPFRAAWLAARRRHELADIRDTWGTRLMGEGCGHVHSPEMKDTGQGTRCALTAVALLFDTVEATFDVDAAIARASVVGSVRACLRSDEPDMTRAVPRRTPEVVL